MEVSVIARFFLGTRVGNSVLTNIMPALWYHVNWEETLRFTK